MKRHTFVIALVFALFLLNGGTARMASFDRPEGTLRSIPRPPAAGRGGESRVTRWLSDATVTYAVWLQRGKRYLGRKEFEQAIWAFRKALRERPLAEEAHFLLGVAYERRGLEGLPGDVTNWDQLAEEAYRSAIAVADHLPARGNLARLLERNDRFPEARRQWEHILTVAPSSGMGRISRQALERNTAADLLPRLVGEGLPESIPLREERRQP